MALLPLKDDNPHVWIRFQAVTAGIVAVCTLVYLFEYLGGEDFTNRLAIGLGIIPSVFWGDKVLPPDLYLVAPKWSLLSYMFLHGSWMHLIGNMLFLWIFGDNVEDSMGHWRFVAFYLICGVAAALTHAAIAPGSDSPTIGASGAISGILGAYFVLHPKVKVWALLFWIIPIPIRIPTFVVLGIWFATDLVNALFGDVMESHVAWWAHIGGFLAGAILIRWFKYDHVPLWDKSSEGHPGVTGFTLPSERRKRDSEDSKDVKGPWGRHDH